MLRKGFGRAICSTRWILKIENYPLAYAALTTSARKLQLEKEAIEDEGKYGISKANDVPTLLEWGIKDDIPVKAYQTIQILSEWVEVKKINFKEDVESDTKFGRLLSIIERDTRLNNPLLLLNGLKNLYKLGVGDNAYVVQCAENNLMWNVRKVSIPLLLSILLFQRQHQNTDLQKKALKETVDTLQRRWVEVRGAKEIQQIYIHHDLFTQDFIGRLDDRTIELAEEMKYDELSGIFCSLGIAKRRATPVLRALAFHMAKQEEKLLPKQLSNILFAMHTLSFPDQVLLEKISKDLMPQIVNIDRSAIVGSILFCMGQMRWRHTSLLELLSEWIENNINECRINDLVSMVLTLASVSYTPTNADRLFTVVIPKLQASSVEKETVWLDIVWSLTLLGRATNDHISSVLDQSFVSKTASVARHLRMGIKLKLLNINAVARLTMPSYNGPFLDVSNFKDIIITQSRNELILIKHVQCMLHNFLPPPKYIIENIQTPMGIIVDCELSIDKKGKPIPIQDFSDNFGLSQSAQPLPEGASKIALFVWDYRDYTIGSQELVGVNQLAVNLMEKIGHKVVQVPYFEYNMRAKTIKSIKYLESKIKEVVNES